MLLLSFADTVFDAVHRLFLRGVLPGLAGLTIELADGSRLSWDGVPWVTLGEACSYVSIVFAENEADDRTPSPSRLPFPLIPGQGS